MCWRPAYKTNGECLGLSFCGALLKAMAKLVCTIGSSLYSSLEHLKAWDRAKVDRESAWHHACRLDPAYFLGHFELYVRDLMFNYAHAQTVCTRPFPCAEGLAMRLLPVPTSLTSHFDMNILYVYVYLSCVWLYVQCVFYCNSHDHLNSFQCWTAISTSVVSYTLVRAALPGFTF